MSAFSATFLISLSGLGMNSSSATKNTKNWFEAVPISNNCKTKFPKSDSQNTSKTGSLSPKRSSFNFIKPWKLKYTSTHKQKFPNTTPTIKLQIFSILKLCKVKNDKRLPSMKGSWSMRSQQPTSCISLSEKSWSWWKVCWISRDQNIKNSNSSTP